ncbi:MAG: hypothetical protein Q9227_004301 [Pyrenula ochraceoflavens]
MLVALKNLLALGLFLLPALATSNSTNCTNTPTTRSCWKDGYNINTDFYSQTPIGTVVEYDFVITEATISPDGYETVGMVINGQYPGPAIEANWGDTIRVTFHNNLDNYNGTSIHMHGIHQYQTNYEDGTPGLTQCPIKVLMFSAMQRGKLD